MNKHYKLHVGKTGHESWVEIDGERLDNVTSVSVVVAAGKPTSLRIELIPVKMTVEIDEEVWQDATKGGSANG